MEIDITRFLDTVQRRLTTAEHYGHQTRVVTIVRPYKTDQADLWDALTNRERILRWFLPVTGDLHVGGRYQLEGNAEGEVLACQAPDRFEITWEFGGFVSWVHVTLVPEEGATKMVLEHIAPITDHDEFWDQFGPGAVGVGWDLGLFGLELHIETKNAVDSKEVEAWSASPEGSVFITASSTAWGQASIEAGTSPEAAFAAVNNTTAFYTGKPQGGDQPEE